MLHHNSKNNIEIFQDNNLNLNLNNYNKNCRERYIASLAIKNNITYEEADVLEKTYIDNNIEDYKNFIIEYKTINKLAGVIQSSEYKQKIYIDVEIRYLKDKTNYSFSKIDELGGIVVYLNNIDNNRVNINAGEYNIEKYETTARISQTAIIEYKSKENPKISSDIASIEKSGKDYLITTKAKTYVINVTNEDFE